MSGRHARTQAAQDAAVLLRAGSTPESVLGILQVTAQGGEGTGLAPVTPREEVASGA